jgi:hypothetical protein
MRAPRECAREIANRTRAAGVLIREPASTGTINETRSLSMLSMSRRTRVVAGVAASAFALSVGVASASTSKPDTVRFPMFAQNANINCMKASPGAPTPRVSVEVDRHNQNDTATVELRNFKPRLNFDLFTIQHSPQTATGAADANPSVGLAWYQSDIHVGSDGTGRARIRTILLDQIFGVDKDIPLAPTNTFHLGFWFNNPADAHNCGFTGTTPFNGEHTAGPLAFVTRPDATTNLGPLCTSPTSGPGGTFTCNP